MDGVTVSKETAGKVFEEEAEVDKAVDVSCESLVLLPPEEGANVVWRLAVSRRR